jgi:serine/threonine-protein kinase
MEEFVQKVLSLVGAINNDFFKWQAIQEKLFPSSIPTRVIWEEISEIVDVLNLLSSYQINHMLYPDGGGLDLESAALGKESDTIELIPGHSRLRERVELVKPERLIFERFGSNPEWNYFRLETGGLEPSGVDIVYRDCEEVAAIDNGYIERYHWYEGSYNDKKLPSTARLIRRYLKGTFLIIQKSSVYNHIDTYVGLHNQKTTDEFRDYISQKLRTYNKLITSSEVEKLAREENISPRDVAINYMRSETLDEYRDENSSH